MAKWPRERAYMFLKIFWWWYGATMNIRWLLPVLVIAVALSGCAGVIFDPTQPAPYYYGSCIRWTEPSPTSEYHRGYWDEKLRAAEQRRWQANQNAFEAGRNRARQEELQQGGWTR